MAVNYKKLRKMLIDKDMKKEDLTELASMSSYTITKMSKGENVTTDTLGKRYADSSQRKLCWHGGKYDRCAKAHCRVF